MPRLTKRAAESARCIGRFLWLVPFLLQARAWAAEPGPDLAKLAPVAPCVELQAAAQRRKIPLTGLHPPGDASQLNPGDSFTGLVTLSEKGGRRTQWLMFLEALPAEPKELATKPAHPMVLFSGRSNRFEYGSSPALVRLLTLGPYAADTNHTASKASAESVEFSVDAGFLGLGLERGAATIYRRQHSNVNGSFWFGSKPPGAAQIAEARKLAEGLNLTLEDERALGGMVPALLSYVAIVQHTEALDNILLKVVDKPSVWSVVRHLGVAASLEMETEHVGPGDTHAWGLATNALIYNLPFLLAFNQQPGLISTLVVTAPQPPLLTCGGIIGLLAERPGDPETYLTLRIISARCGEVR